MIGKAIMHGDLEYAGVQGNLLIKENEAKMVKQKAQKHGIKYFQAHPCKEASALFSGRESIVEVCRFNSSLERQSLALLGKRALSDSGNTAREKYRKDFTDAKDLGLVAN